VWKVIQGEKVIGAAVNVSGKRQGAKIEKRNLTDDGKMGGVEDSSTDEDLFELSA
jgi:hypothetical protein